MPVEIFPAVDMVPKQEVQLLDFLASHPEKDGRGIVIAVLDQGCDPNAFGLRQTSDGKVKIIDCIDTTGSGDVDTSHKVKTEIIDGKEYITGLTGRKIEIKSDWENETDEWNIGILDLKKIFPSYVTKRMAKKSKEENWSPHYQKTLSTATTHHNEMKKLEQTNLESKLKLEDAKERIDNLKKIDSDFENLEFLTDLIVFKTKEGVLKACLIYDGNQKTMADYSNEYEWCCLSHDTQLNYSFKLYSLTEACVVCINGSHGTHVAGIAAAYHPDAPEKNGTAPGAQVVSIKIGDSRVDTLETTPGVVRALRACIQNNVSVANLSYGEPAGYFQKGAFFEELKTTFLKHKMLFITSAGNSGPALTTVGAPASLGEYALSVGAYAAPKSHEPLYSMPTELPEINYTWSSRGPTMDGGRGVDVCAPGVAITAVPTATLNRNGLMNGTSMAAPNATGCAATILSALPKDYDWTPAQLKRVLMNTARNVVGVESESQGAGLVQVSSAVEKFQATDNTHYKIAIGSKRGIYIRHPSKRNDKIVYRVEITPEFHKSVKNEQICEFEKHLIVKNRSKWIETPQFVHMSSATKGFAVTVDVKSLPANSRNTCLIELIEDGTREVICAIPVTVIKGRDVKAGEIVEKTKNFAPGEIVRDYYVVPPHATYAKFVCHGSGGKYLAHSMQTIAGHNYTKYEDEWFLNITEGTRPRVFYYKVMPGETLEMVMSKFWSETNQDGELTWTIQFGGMEPKANILHINPGITTLDFTNATSEKLSPKIEFQRVEIPLVPQSIDIISLSHPLDQPLQLHQNSYKAMIQYDLKLSNDGEVQIEIPMLREVLYESMFAESNFFIYNSDNKRVHFGENFKPTNWKKKLTKGDYKVIVELVHTNKNLLETISKKMIILNSLKLKDNATMDCYLQRDEAILAGGNKADNLVTSPGTRNHLFINSNGSNLDKDDAAKMEGRTLSGTMSFYTGDLKNSFKLGVKYGIQPKSDIKEKEVKAKKDTSIEALQRDQAVAWVKNGDGEADFFNKQKELYPDHVPLLHARLQHLLKKGKAGAAVVNEEINELCLSIINNINLKEVIYNLNKKGISNAEEKRTLEDNKELKSAFISAKIAQIRTLIHSYTSDKKATIVDELSQLNEVSDIFAEKSNAEMLKMLFELGSALELPGLQIRSLIRLNDSKSSKENVELLEQVYNKLEWNFACEQQKRNTVANYPLKQYRI